MVKLEILLYVVQSFSKKCMSVHHINEFVYEQEEESCLKMKKIVLFNKNNKDV